MQTHVHAIQAYFQNGELNIQFTKFHVFSESDSESKYIATMNCLLKWADARLCGDTLAVHSDEKLAGKFCVTSMIESAKELANQPELCLISSNPFGGPPFAEPEWLV